MAAHMRACLPAGVLDGATLVPIPSWTAERLAHALGRATRRPVTACLARAARTPTRQLGRTRTARRERGALLVTGRRPAPGPVVLVDDVHTTGATLERGAKALRSAGFRQIAAVTFVRTLTSA